MSKMSDSIIDVPMNDSDYDYVKEFVDSLPQVKVNEDGYIVSDYIQIDPEEIKKLNCSENSVVCECEKGEIHSCLNCGVDSHYSYCDDCQKLADNQEEN